MKFLLICSLVSAVFGYQHLHKLEPEDSWEEWKEFFKQDYGSPVEEARRYNIFRKHHAYVNSVNNGQESFTLALNEFAATDPQEFKMFHNGLKPDSSPPKGLVWNESMTNGTVPDAIDWRTKGLVNPVKNQAQCGSCWAFSTIVSTEGQMAKVSGKLTSLSEQDLVDCVKNVPYEGDKCCMGCQGGLMVPAFMYMQNAQDGTDDFESSYPYKGANGSCKFKATTAEKGLKIGNYTQGHGEPQLKQMSGTVGPISVGVDASKGWQLYHGGIMKPKGFFGKCSSDPKKMDHGVAVVGYGDGYWIIRNSWGPGWGEKGYMRLATGGNYCGVANVPSYPNVVKN